VSKADLKLKSTPGHRSAPYVCLPIPPAEFPDLIPVIDRLGSFLFMADEPFARELLKKQQVRICRTKKNIRALQLKAAPDAALAKLISQRRYFGVPHRRETETNPARVWTQDQMGHTNGEKDRLMPVDDRRAEWCRRVCMEVVRSCSKAA
jgi:hypothetical protein